jgi:hypothetical protein
MVEKRSAAVRNAVQSELLQHGEEPLLARAWVHGT